MKLGITFCINSLCNIDPKHSNPKTYCVCWTAYKKGCNIFNNNNIFQFLPATFLSSTLTASTLRILHRIADTPSLVKVWGRRRTGLQKANAINAPVKSRTIGRMRNRGRTGPRTLARSNWRLSTATFTTRQICAHATKLNPIKKRRGRTLARDALSEVALVKARTIVPVRHVNVHTTRTDALRWIRATTVIVFIVYANCQTRLLTETTSNVKQQIALA